MKKYRKPYIENIQEYTEGIYMSSGDSSCYTASSHIHQKPETGRGDYRIQVDGKHRASHTKEKQILHIHFNLPVEYISSGGKLITGDGSTVLHIQYNYHQNPADNIGLGDLVVCADSGLSITKIYITD